MKSIFTKELAKALEIRKQYDIAYESNDEVGKAAARKAMQELKDSIWAMGNEYFRVFQMALDSMEKGNDLIDLHDSIWDEHVPAFIENLRKCGIDRFTFSSTWSSAVKTAWLFLQNGCTNEGMIEIHTGNFPYGGAEEMAPAYIFSIH